MNRARPASTRRPASREARKTYLVLTEGSTEQDYVGIVRRQLHHRGLKIESPSVSASDPLGVVRGAVKRKKEAAAKGSPFDEVWCLLDVDSHTNLNEALQLARSSGVYVAISSVCFEVWLIWHFRELESHTSAGELRRLLKEHIPSYDKRLERLEGQILGKYGAARTRALQATSNYDRNNLPRHANPSSTVYLLVDSVIDSYKRFDPNAPVPRL